MDNNLHKGANKKIFEYARENRLQQTAAEAILWKKLRDRNFYGYKFRRQHPLDSFIVDFYCHSHKLAIEIDGGYHNEQEQAEYDSGRTYELQKYQVTVIRFSNEEVMGNTDWVLNKIKSYLVE